MIDSVSAAAGADDNLRRKKQTGGHRPQVDRLPPHSIECEMGALGCVMLSPNDCLLDCIKKLWDGVLMFYDLRHQEIYKALLQMYEAREAIDIITLQQWLKDRQMLEQVGGIAYLSSLPDTVPSAANLSYYLDFIAEKYILRRMIHTCTDVVGRVYDYEGEVEALLDEIERDILRIRPKDNNKETNTASLINDAMEEISSMHVNQGQITGISTGLSDLDSITDGAHPGEVIVVAGYPSTGKTALAGNIAVHVSLHLGLPTIIFSFEMKPVKLMIRAILGEAQVNKYDIRDGIATAEEYDRVTNAAIQIKNSPIDIVPCSGMTIHQLKAIARRHYQKMPFKVAFIDYLQLVSMPEKGDKREQEVSGISKGIKQLALELDVPIFVLSQLNDDGKLRESRAIGQDADSIWRLKNKGKDKHRHDQPIMLDILKCRDGSIGEVELMFRKQFTRFQSVSKIHPDDAPLPQAKLL